MKKFAESLKRFREYKGLSPTELAKKMGVSAGYVFNLESGKQKPPTITRIEQIASILSLSEKEAMELSEAAAEERIPELDKRLLKRPRVAMQKFSPEILEALQDPIAVKALLITYKNSQDIKNTIKSLLECLPSLPPEKRQAILALCK